MGNILVWLGRGLYLGGGALVGLLFEKISSAIAGVLPASIKGTGKDGGPLAMWFVVAVSIIAGIGVYLVTKLLVGKKKVLSLLLLMMACFAVDAAMGLPAIPLITASLLLSIAASSEETKTIQYLPEIIVFNIGTVPDNFRISMVGDGVVFALDGTGLTNLNGIRAKGQLPSNQYIYQVADGYIGKNATFTIDNAHAGQLDVYGFSNSKGKQYLTYNMNVALANASLDMKNFDYAAFPSAAADDTFTVTWADGTTDDLSRIELESYLVYKQEVTATRYNLDNFMREVRRVQFRGALEQNVYYVRRQPAKSVVNQSL